MNSSITYIHKNAASRESQIIQAFMSLAGMKNDIENTLKRKKITQEAAPIPNSLKKNFDFKLDALGGQQTFIFKPRQNISNKVILFLHGGAYILNSSKYHWDFVEKLLHKTNATVVVPDYPLAPRANCVDAYCFMEEIYLQYLAKIPSSEMIFMGDSAGAGLAFGFAQELRNKNRKQASQIILISPWLDITLNNPNISELDKKDKVLGIKGLQMAGKAYAGELNPKDFKVSPIYGKLSGLGKISVFIGSHDLLLADVKKLVGLMKKENIPLNYFEYPKMFHAWAIFTRLKESQHALEQIALLVNKSE